MIPSFPSKSVFAVTLIGTKRDPMASRRPALFKPDPWLARVLGRPVYRGVGPWRPGWHFPGPGFYYTRTEATDIGSCKGWLKAGFRQVDVTVVAERLPSRVSVPPSVHVRPFLSRDAAFLCSWVGDAFVYSRFHLDPGFPLHVAVEVKRAWMKEYLAGRRADRVWVVSKKGRAVGFLGRMIAVEGDLRVGILDLMAVRKGEQGRGFGDALVRHFIRDSVGSCDLLRVGTQAANVSSLRLYQRCGFKITASHFVLHAHRGGRV